MLAKCPGGRIPQRMEYELSRQLPVRGTISEGIPVNLRRSGKAELREGHVHEWSAV
jgi:hypothetical protein